VARGTLTEGFGDEGGRKLLGKGEAQVSRDSGLEAEGIEAYEGECPSSSPIRISKCVMLMGADTCRGIFKTGAFLFGDREFSCLRDGA
jgi:hypothetical protein